MFCSGVLLDDCRETDIDLLLRHYSRLEEQVRVENSDARTSYRSPVNFIESMQQPRHRWFPYKEGFSPSFVRGFIEEFGAGSDLVFDPFSGSGTTPIVAAEMGLRSLGMDVSPLTSFVAKTKAIALDGAEVCSFDQEIARFESSGLSKMAAPPVNETVCRYFLPHYLEALLRVKAYISEIEDQRFRDLFRLAFLTAVEPFSTHRKAGNGVKKKTRSSFAKDAAGALRDVREFMHRQLRIYLADIEDTSEVSGAAFKEVSSLEEDNYADVDPISCVLTSPPYANCFDYSKIYLSELWLGDFFRTKEDHKAFREHSVRSHVHSTWGERHATHGSDIVEDLIRGHIDAQDLWSPRIGGMLAGYFQDLGKLLATLKPRLSPRAPLGFVVGNSFYGGVAVATDLLLAELALTHGYDVQEIRVYRGVIPSSQQYRLLGQNRKYMRESLVILRAASC